MGVNLKDLVIRSNIEFKDLTGKRIAFDAYNVLYQFLSAIRQRDGTPLKDSHGRITSHLTGLFYRTINLLEYRISPIFVFDGKSLELKRETQEARALIKLRAEEKYKKAIAKKDLEQARKYAQQTSRLTPEMVKEAKDLLRAMGIPTVQALADGEAQAAYLVQKKLAYTVASQDYDALLFGAPFLVRNLTVSERRKVPGKAAYDRVKPELVVLADVLNHLKIDLKQLVHVAMLIGTDFNPGVKGIGPKTALKLVQGNKMSEYKSKIARFRQVEELFLKPAITTGFTVEWKKPNQKKIKRILCDEHDFSVERIDTALRRLDKKMEARKQSDLERFI